MRDPVEACPGADLRDPLARCEAELIALFRDLERSAREPYAPPAEPAGQGGLRPAGSALLGAWCLAALPDPRNWTARLRPPRTVAA